MDKFKVGDRVVLVGFIDAALDIKVGTSGVVKGLTYNAKFSVRVRFDTGRTDNMNINEIELESVYNSPLFKALK